MKREIDYEVTRRGAMKGFAGVFAGGVASPLAEPSSPPPDPTDAASDDIRPPSIDGIAVGCDETPPDETDTEIGCELFRGEFDQHRAEDRPASIYGEVRKTVSFSDIGTKNVGGDIVTPEICEAGIITSEGGLLARQVFEPVVLDPGTIVDITMPYEALKSVGIPISVGDSDE
jgi:hypothetical protein